MTQGFDEWYSTNSWDIENYYDAEKGYKAGAASRQAEIDELQKRINLALSAVWNDELSHIVIDILKGENNE